MSWILTDTGKCQLWRGGSEDLDFERHCARTYAVMWNTLDPSLIGPLAADDIVHESQQVLTPLEGKSAMTTYLDGKMETIREHGEHSRVFAEIGEFQNRPCVIVAQGYRELDPDLSWKELWAYFDNKYGWTEVSWGRTSFSQVLKLII